MALNRPSYLSSTLTSPEYGTYWISKPSKGNDGDKINCGNWDPNSVAITEVESNPWFAVDLGVAMHVAGVRLSNRADAFGTCATGCIKAFKSVTHCYASVWPMTLTSICCVRPGTRDSELLFYTRKRTCRSIQGGPKIMGTKFLQAVTLPNINRFS